MKYRRWLQHLADSRGGHTELSGWEGSLVPEIPASWRVCLKVLLCFLRFTGARCSWQHPAGCISPALRITQAIQNLSSPCSRLLASGQIQIISHMEQEDEVGVGLYFVRAECVYVCVCICVRLWGYFMLSEHFSILFTIRLQTRNVMQRKRQLWHACKFPGHHQSVGVLAVDSAPESLFDWLSDCRQQLISKILFTLKKPQTIKPQPSPPRKKCHYVQL